MFIIFHPIEEEMHFDIPWYIEIIIPGMLIIIGIALMIVGILL